MPDIGKTPQISIIILNWNTPEDTIKCIESILRNTIFDSYEIIVIDNGSDRKEKEKIKERSKTLPDFVKIIYLPKNLGVPAGYNCGVSVAKGKYFEIMNSDTTVEKDWLKEKLNTFLSEPNVAGVTSRLFEDNCYVYSDQKQYLKTLHGASMMISRLVFERVGEFDAKNFSPLYSDELDWSYRARRMGFKLLLSPKSVVYHHCSQSAKKYSDNKTMLYIRLRNRMKHRLFNYTINDWLDKNEFKQFTREFYHSIRDGYLFLLIKAWMTTIFDIQTVIYERIGRRKRRNRFKIQLIKDS